MSVDRKMEKEDVVHIYTGISLSHEKEQNIFTKRNRFTDLENQLMVTKEKTQ